MTTLFGPGELFSALSCAIADQDPDELLPAGAHLRVFAGLSRSFPLAPFAVFKVPTSDPTPSMSMHFTDEQHRPLTNLANVRTCYAQPEFFDGDDVRTVALGFFPIHPDDFAVQLFGPRGRLLAERRTPPFVFSVPAFARFRLTGNLLGTEFARQAVDVRQTLLQAPPAAVALLGLPVTGRHAWYLGVHTRDDALTRVVNGFPAHLSVMDQPEGHPITLNSTDEQFRIESLLANATFGFDPGGTPGATPGSGLEKMLDTMITQGTMPWRQTESVPLHDDRNQVAGIPRLGALQMAAIDPGMARFLGFADRIDDQELAAGRGEEALAIIGILAIDPGLVTQLPHLAQWLQQPSPDEPALINLTAAAIKTITGADVGDQLTAVIQDARRRGCQIRAMIAVTKPTPPWVPPQVPLPAVVDRRWQASDGITPSSLYRATLAFPEAPLSAMAAVARQEDGHWAPMHDFLPVRASSVNFRAAPRFFGSENVPGPRVREQLTAGTPVPLDGAAILTEQDLPAGEGTMTYRFRGADVFGRFGGPADVTFGPPDRPAPPPPVIRYYLDLHADDLAGLSPDGALSPGTVRLTIAVPPAQGFAETDEPRIRTAILVPGLAGLAAGSLPIRTLTIALDGGAPHTVDVTAPGFTDLPLPLPGLQPQAQASHTLTAMFTDTVGTKSDPELASVTFTVMDRRLPPAIKTGVGLFWTSSPGPGPEVQLKLAWHAAPKSKHRVYAIDQQGLGLTDADLGVSAPAGSGPQLPPSRAKVAAAGADKVLHGPPVGHSAFHLLADTVTADDSGLAILDTTLPRSLQTVQFLRIVPLTSEGGETPFDRCGIVAVAVPDSRRPAPPRLDGSVDPATGVAHFVVTADGFDRVDLSAEEPGLFTPSAGPAVAPRFRILRAVAAVADPIYAREVASGSLAHDAAQDPRVVFSGKATDPASGPGLEPFVRYVYWAQVQLPPERRVPPGPPAANGDLHPLDPASAADRPRPMSLPSAPRTLMRTPPAAPAAPRAADIRVTRTDAADGVHLTIAITSPPAAHPMAIGPFRLAIWRQWPGQAIAPVTVSGGTSPDGTWPALGSGPVTVTVPPPVPPAAPTGPLTVRLAYVDPAGRLGDLTQLTVS
jgi:hypothetical protein